MKLLSFEIDGRHSFGAVRDDGIVDLGAALEGRHRSLKALIEADALDVAQEVVENRRPDHGLSEITWKRPVVSPGKILCVGVNYMNRNEEYRDGSELPRYPSLFMRTPGSLTGHLEPLMRPPESDQFDYEGEIVIIVGKSGRRIAEAAAADHIFGLTLMNEGSVRDWLRHGKFNVTQGKNFEQSGSVGPWIVSREACGPLDKLEVETHVNGERRQHGLTSDLMFSFERIIAYISTFTELHPGDLIATGTPPGAGARFDPPKYLQAGDVVEISSPQIGTLRNIVRDEVVSGGPA
jgi:2-keto-4-pentenoate hydratase/2-oxohepta-3-ene-1,7-dioic acid hydratase in catechol pathway